MTFKEFMHMANSNIERLAREAEEQCERDEAASWDERCEREGNA